VPSLYGRGSLDTHRFCAYPLFRGDSRTGIVTYSRRSLRLIAISGRITSVAAASEPPDAGHQHPQARCPLRCNSLEWPSPSPAVQVTSEPTHNS
jgi:hypothetical protein